MQVQAEEPQTREGRDGEGLGKRGLVDAELRGLAGCVIEESIDLSGDVHAHQDVQWRASERCDKSIDAHRFDHRLDMQLANTRGHGASQDVFGLSSGL